MQQILKPIPSVTGRSYMRVLRTRRPGGRRIQIVGQDGSVVYDTDDCYDMANAVSKAEAWAAEHEEIL